MPAHTIHHVTAITAGIGSNLEFYTKTLGLRLVKRTVNQDDPGAYHLFYGDALGAPGSDITFFDWPWAAPARAGRATVARTTFRVPPGSLDFWAQRLRDCRDIRQDDDRIIFADPEGQCLELKDDGGLPGAGSPWTAAVPHDYAIRGILGVSIESAKPGGTMRVLTEVLGYTRTSDEGFESSDEDRIARIELLPDSGGGMGRVGAGGVHHVAFRATGPERLVEFQEQIESLGMSTSGLVDRFWFKSLYFREPGGILFEIATDGPGFAADEHVEHLGERLVLPPFLEPRRQEIEARLKPLPKLKERADQPA